MNLKTGAGRGPPLPTESCLASVLLPSISYVFSVGGGRGEGQGEGLGKGEEEEERDGEGAGEEAFMSTWHFYTHTHKQTHMQTVLKRNSSGFCVLSVWIVWSVLSV